MNPEQEQQIREAVRAKIQPTTPSNDLQGQIRASIQRQRQQQAPQAVDSATLSPIQAGIQSAKNLPRSFGRFVGGVGKAILNPIETVKGIGQVAGGGLRTAGEAVGLVEDNKDTQSEQMFDMFTGSLKERYGSLENLQRTAVEDPFGFGADVVGLFAGGLTTARTAGLTRTTRALEGVSDVAQTTARAVTSPITRIQNAASGALPRVATAAVERLKFTTGKQASDFKDISLDKVNPSTWLAQRQFSGDRATIIKDLNQYNRGAYNFLNRKLAQNDQKFAINDINPNLKIAIEQVAEAYDTPLTQDIVNKAKSLIKDEYTIAEVNEVKRFLDKRGSIFKTSGEVRAGAQKLGLADVRTSLRKWIEDTADELNLDIDVKRVNNEIRVSRKLSDDMTKRAGTQDTNRLFGLTDFLFGGTAFAGTGNPIIAITATLMKKVLENEKLLTKLSTKLAELPADKQRILEQASLLERLTPEATVIYLDLLNRVVTPELLQEQEQESETTE